MNLINPIKRHSLWIILALTIIIGIVSLDAYNQDATVEYTQASNLYESITKDGYMLDSIDQRAMIKRLVEKSQGIQNASYFRKLINLIFYSLAGWGILELLILLVTRINLLDDKEKFRETFTGLALLAAAILISSSSVFSSEIPKTGVEVIKHFEGVELTAYPDPGTNGDPWTIGYGSTKNVRPGMVISKETAEAWLKRDLRTFNNYLDKNINRYINDNERSALISFVYNVGSLYGNMRRTVISGSPEAKYWFKKYIRAGGRILNGLVRRRNAEAEIYFSNCSVIRKFNMCGC
jgi:lysozyme